MKNPNSLASRLKRHLAARWSSEDYPGADPRFQVLLFAKDVGTYLLLPLGAVFLYKFVDSPSPGQRRPVASVRSQDASINAGSRSQIIEFKGSGGTTVSNGAFAKRSPGTLVRLRLLNVVETYSTAPVHAQVIDAGLGDRLIGATLIGDAAPDTNFERINITFRFVRDPNRVASAAQVSARALSLDGTLGLEANKKEGFVARAAIGSAHTSTQEMQGKGSSTDLKDILFRALTAGLVQELGNDTQVERNRAQVLTLPPSKEFFAELTDYFPGNSK